MKLELRNIAKATGGTILPPGATATVTGISTDSRTISPGDLFIPLRGPNFDGHDYLIQAVRRGAAACLAEEIIGGFPAPVVHVRDTLHALGDLATARRLAFDGQVVGITGSSGKTTTKEMLTAVLSLESPVLKTEGNYNNLIGLPLTLLRLDEKHRHAVIEMGTSALGEIARLTEIARPDIGVITNVGPAHLETLHGLDGVARAKGELFAGLPAEGIAVVNIDDERVRSLPLANGVRRLAFGLSPEATVRGSAIRQEKSTICFTLTLPDGEARVLLRAPGRHNVHNALAAAAAAHALGLGVETIARGLNLFRPGNGRLVPVTLPCGALLFDDTYNANPASTRAALQVLSESNGGQRIAVLGDMLELGELADDLHFEIGREAAKHCDLLVVMGEMARQVADGALAGGMDKRAVRIVPDHRSAAALVCDRAGRRDRVLVKGSRGMKMEKVCAALRERHDTTLAVVI